MFYKRCSRCSNRLEYNKVCDCIKRYKVNSDDYKNEKEKSFYKSTVWQKKRLIAINQTNSLDIYSYYILGTIEYGETVHHIEELKEAWDKRLSLDNLIYLTEKNHRIIHNLMKKSSKDKKDIEVLLKKLKQRYKNEFI